MQEEELNKTQTEDHKTVNMNTLADTDVSSCGEEDPGAALEFLLREDIGEPEPH